MSGTGSAALLRRSLVAGLPALGLVRPREAAAQDAAWDKVVAAAKQEGEVRYYSGSVGEPDDIAITKDFERRYGIPVRVLEARASEIRERTRTELATGQVSGDVMYNGRSTMESLKADGLLQPLGALPLAGNLRPPFVLDQYYAPVMVNPYGLLINTRLVPDADAPKSWQDILDPKWHGKILADDPRALGGGNVAAAVLLEKFGRAFHEKLAAQAPVFSRDQRQSQRRVARGEFPLYLPFTTSDILRLQGLPVREITPTQGDPYVVFTLAVIRNARSANAARLLINHFFEASSGRVFLQSVRPLTVPASEDGLTAQQRALVDIKLMGEQDTSKTDQYLATFREIYK